MVRVGGVAITHRMRSEEAPPHTGPASAPWQPPQSLGWAVLRSPADHAAHSNTSRNPNARGSTSKCRYVTESWLLVSGVDERSHLPRYTYGPVCTSSAWV